MSRADEFDVDDYFDEYLDVLRGDVMEAFRKLHDVMEQTVDAIGTDGAMDALEEAIARVEEVEHALMETRAAERLRIDIGHAMEGR